MAKSKKPVKKVITKKTAIKKVVKKPAKKIINGINEYLAAVLLTSFS